MQVRGAAFVWLVLACLLPANLSAQAITAKVVGAITDSTGASVRGATVTIRSVQTNQARTTSSDEAGNYEFPFLPVGSYKLAVQFTGFRNAEVSEFTLNVDQVARIDVQLQVGDVTETVSVVASTIGLQTEGATVGTVIDSQKVLELPLNGRSFVQLALLTPGVNPGTPGSITVRRNRGAVGQAVAMSANGFRDTQNRFYYDGIEAMDLDSYNFSFSPSIDAVQEFKVETSTYSADIGGAPGGQLNLTTKSGTSKLHGGAWEFNRNDAFAALAPFQPFSPDAKPPRLNRNQFGANLGGPVVLPKVYSGRDTTFFFFNWESGRQMSGSFGGTGFLPPLPYRSGDFSGSPIRIVDPQTGQPFPNNRIPAERIRNYARKFMDFVPPPNANEPSINFRGPRASAPINQDQYTSRVDHRFNARNSIYGSYTFNSQVDNSVPIFGFDTRGNATRTQHTTLTDTHIFSATVVNEIRLGWDRFFEHEYFGTTNRPELDIGNIIGIPGVSKLPQNYGPPTFSGAGYELPTVRTNGPRDRLNQLWQGGDNLSIRRGNQSIKVGGLVARRNWTFDQSPNPRGVFTFDGRTVSGGVAPVREQGFAAFLLGLATRAEIATDLFSRRQNQWVHAYYFADDWKVRPNLTLNFGVRYEYFSPPVQRGPATNFDLNGVIPGFVPSRQTFHGLTDIADTADRPASLVFPDRNNFGPRFGFAYNVPQLRDFVLRGGYGMYFTPEITNSYGALTRNPPIVKSFQFTGTFDKPLQVDQAFGGAGQLATSFSAGVVDPNLRDTYAQQWNLTVQKKLPRDVYVDLGYVGSKGTNLTLSFDGNRPIRVVTPGPGVPALGDRRPLAGYANVSVTKSIGDSIYHAMQLKVERRVGRGLSLLGAYTWSKSLSNADISTVGGGTYLGAIQDYFNMRADRSPSVFDIRHRLSMAAIYDVPLFAHAPRAAVRTLLGGWQLGTIITEQTGFSATLQTVGDTTGTGVSSRPSVVAGQKANLSRSERSRDRWFNTPAFTSTPLGSFGTASRQPIYLPGLSQVDFSVTKNFRLFEAHTLQFRAEFFNFFNHVNLGSPGLNIQQPNSFGRITTSSQTEGATNDARIIQFGLKYRF
ncbi:MAG: TonB-dependent receptor [Acidobacteria bacterium]|nr:TonB-dependent receptor [Acidobacteriota bacterium]